MGSKTHAVDGSTETTEDDTFRHPKALVDELERGDVVEVMYLDQEQADVTSGWKLTGETKTVKGIVTGAGGTLGSIGVKLYRGAHSGSVSLRIADVPSRTVTGTAPYSNRTKRKGLDARIRRTGERDEEGI